VEVPSYVRISLYGGCSKISRKGTLFSSYLDHRDGVSLLFFGREHLSGHFFSSYNHGGLGNDHDPYVFGEFLQGPHHVSSLFIH
jgi:hypothetical protein